MIKFHDGPNDYCDNHPLPTKSQIKDVLLWLLTVGYNDHSFRWVFSRSVTDILHYAGMHEEGSYLYSIHEKWPVGSDRQKMAEEMIRYVENW